MVLAELANVLGQAEPPHNLSGDKSTFTQWVPPLV